MHHTTAVEKKKIAVHCHAGLGRTGLSIACFLVFHGEASATQAVELVRQQRPGAVQTKAQVLFVSIFEQYLQHLRCDQHCLPEQCPWRGPARAGTSAVNVTVCCNASESS